MAYLCANATHDCGSCEVLISVEKWPALNVRGVRLNWVLCALPSHVTIFRGLMGTSFRHKLKCEVLVECTLAE